jgi:endonuclease YncB( thermonuclease family)
VSRHWKSQRTEWLSPEAYDALTPDERKRLWGDRKAQRGSAGKKLSGTTIGVVLAAAACAGISFGLSQSKHDVGATDGSGIEWNAVQAVPTRAPDAEDVEWEKRSEDWAPDRVRGSGERTQDVRVAFGYCKWGGGTNCVVDGDTFYLNGDKVRIAGIDAPETHDYRCASELALGNQATEKLHAMLNSGAVTMTGNDRNRDVYGRLLRNVAVGGEDVGEAMVSAGVAREYGSGRRSWC